ncbi:MAG: hypothetical protein BGO49_17540 [Planctomycetales bacterium 71-10]|nr:MAG: hypothetical protein BGO49_17540 [Planctomycetales bacterium 71-10]
MSHSGFRVRAIPFISASVRGVARWLPTVLVASVSAWGVSILAPPRTSLPADSSGPSIRAIGRGYPRGLASAYATAWLDGAEALESGRGIAEALGVVEKAWKAGRTSLFDQKVAPYFSAVVPEGKPASETSISDRASLAALWREFAAGLASGD